MSSHDLIRVLPADAARRPPPPARGVPLRGHGAQGRRGRERRHAGLDRADARPGRPRPAVPAGEGGAGLGPRAVRRRKSEYAQRGQRVVEGQRLMQAASDIFLGWQRTSGVDGVERDFYVRQLRDWKGSWAPETMVPQAHDALRPDVRLDPGAGARPLGRPDRDRGLPRQERRLRRGDRRVRRGRTRTRTSATTPRSRRRWRGARKIKATTGACEPCAPGGRRRVRLAGSLRPLARVPGTPAVTENEGDP